VGLIQEDRMSNYYKKYERKAFIGLFLVTFCSAVTGFIFLVVGNPCSAKWLATCGLFSTVTGVVQLEISGLFDKVIRQYENEKEYPNGPPSHVTRQIIDNPDRPIRTWLRNISFFNIKTGFWLIVGGTLIQVLAVWV
jgi:hypothetical protein